MSFNQDTWTNEMIMAIFHVNRSWRWWFRFWKESTEYKAAHEKLAKLYRTGSAYYEHAAERLIQNRKHLLKTLETAEKYL